MAQLVFGGKSWPLEKPNTGTIRDAGEWKSVTFGEKNKALIRFLFAGAQLNVTH